jgi:hypothetical protein
MEWSPKYRLVVLSLGLTLISINAILDQGPLIPVSGKRDAPSSSSCRPTKYRRGSPILRIASDSTAYNNPTQTTHCEATNMAHIPMDVSEQIGRSTISGPSGNDEIALLDEHHEHHWKVHFGNDQCMEFDVHDMDPPAVKQDLEHQNMLESRLVHRQVDGATRGEVVTVDQLRGDTARLDSARRTEDKFRESTGYPDTNVVRVKEEQLESEMRLKVQLNQEIS